MKKIKSNIYKKLLTVVKNVPLLRESYNSYKKNEAKSYYQKIKQREQEINNISPSFCSAKWLQETLLLQNGMNHSCHHPVPHKIEIKNLIDNPAGLHNTPQKKEARCLMKKGERPPECEYCWKVEDLETGNLSDRIIKSTDEKWSTPHLQKIINLNDKDDINPTYLEISFENSCNFKCMYCSPDISSSWLEEVKKYGPYPTTHNQGNLDWLKESGRYPYDKNENNPYIEAFWQWWPELSKSLKVLRITGGEPLLSQHTWKVMDLLIKDSSLNFDFSINTNLGVPSSLINKLIDRTNELSRSNKKIEIFTSCEAVGAQAEYIRHGLNYKNFLNNINTILEKTGDNTKISIMITFNILSVSSFLDFVNEIKILKQKYKTSYGYDKVHFMISYLRWPAHFSVLNLSKEIKDEFLSKLEEYVFQEKKQGIFDNSDIDKLQRLCAFIKNSQLKQDEVIQNRTDFYNFIREYDRRKSLSFSETFSELNTYYNDCKKLT